MPGSSYASYMPYYNKDKKTQLLVLMKAKAVARATPAFRPMLELVGETWHAPMLVEADRRDGPADKRDQDPPAPSHWRSSAPQGPVADRSEAPREFEW